MYFLFLIFPNIVFKYIIIILFLSFIPQRPIIITNLI